MIIEEEDLKLCQNALDKLHLMSNCYRANGHMERDVFGPFCILQSLLNELERLNKKGCIIKEPEKDIFDELENQVRTDLLF